MSHAMTSSEVFKNRDLFRDQGYFTMEQQKPGPGLVRYQDFAKREGLEPNLKMFSKNVLNWENVLDEQIGVTCSSFKF